MNRSTAIATLLVVLALAGGLGFACTSERATEDGAIDSFGNAKSVRVTCENGNGKVIYEGDVDNFNDRANDTTGIVHEGRCVRIAHPEGNIYFCGYACSIVPLKK
jgi:uncharacterized membrane protein